MHLPLFFGTNVKMHQTLRESESYVAALAAQSARSGLQRFVILPFTSLAAVAPAARRAGIWVGAQNVHWAQAGEFTGEISAPMLRDIGVDVVLIGHAERRHVFGESDAVVRRKTEAALASGLRVLLCVGETAEERRAGAGPETIVRQLKLALSDVRDRANLLVAYEPVWAIGSTGSAAEPAALVDAIAALRAYIPDVPLLYGGSVSAESAAAYAALSGIDGLFVGRAARTPDGYAAVAAAAYPNLATITR